ncbi:hypothetical protein BH23ACI1_BH23ACI1_14410 [soil metagenome]
MLDQLIACAGEWRGTNMLQDPEMNLEAETTASIATITPLVDGRFARLDYTWSYKGTPQSGSMLIGHQKKPGVVTMHWIDSWHNGEKVMACEGHGHDGAIDVRGSYAAPTGPDWGWRIQVEPSADAVGVRMHNVSPEGQEYPAVEARYRRA